MRKHNKARNKQRCHNEPNMLERDQEVSHSRFCKRFLLTLFCWGVTLHFAPMCIQLVQLILLGSFTLETMCASTVVFEVLVLNFHISKGRILKIGLFQECLVGQIQTITRKLNGRMLKPLNMSQEVSVPDSLRHREHF